MFCITFAVIPKNRLLFDLERHGLITKAFSVAYLFEAFQVSKMIGILAVPCVLYFEWFGNWLLGGTEAFEFDNNHVF